MELFSVPGLLDLDAVVILEQLRVSLQAYEGGRKCLIPGLTGA